LLIQELFFFNDRSIHDGTHEWDNARKIIIEIVGKMSLTMESMKFFNSGTDYQMESGVVVVDLQRNILPITIACAFNAGKLRKEIYQLIYGDKETFWMGFETLGNPYSFNKFGAGVIGVNRMNSKISRICSTQILHVVNGTPFWFNGSLMRYKKNVRGHFAEMRAWIVENIPIKWEWVGSTPCLWGESNMLTEKEINVLQRSREILKKVKRPV